MKSKIVASVVALALILGMVFAIAGPVAASPVWNVSGTWGINVIYLGIPYPESLVLTQSGTDITGVSLNSVPPVFSSAFTITGGTVSGNSVTFHASYNPNSLQTVTFTGTIADNGSMSGTWADDPGFLGRISTWASTSGQAVASEDTANVLGAIAAPNISMVAPGNITFPQFTFGVAAIQETAKYGSVTVVPGSATNVFWSVTAADVGPGSAWGYMKLNGTGAALTNPLYISSTNSGWVPAATGYTVSGENNITNLDFWGDQTAVVGDAAGSYSTTVTFTVAITSFN